MRRDAQEHLRRQALRVKPAAAKKTKKKKPVKTEKADDRSKD